MKLATIGLLVLLCLCLGGCPMAENSTENDMKLKGQVIKTSAAVGTLVTLNGKKDKAQRLMMFTQEVLGFVNDPSKSVQLLAKHHVQNYLDKMKNKELKEMAEKILKMLQDDVSNLFDESIVSLGTKQRFYLRMCLEGVIDGCKAVIKPNSP